MRLTECDAGGRANALWGRGGRGSGSRSNALWGRGGRKAGALVATVAAALALAAVAAAGTGNGSSNDVKAYVDAALLSAAQLNPARSFDVIVEGDKQGNSNGLVKQLVGDSAFGGSAVQIQQQFSSIDGLQASLTGQQVLSLAKRPYVIEIVANDGVAASWYGTPSYSNVQLWPSVIGAQSGWAAANLSTPTIAIVDSGIDASRTGNFGYSRILTQVNLASLTPNSPGDGYGHGTMVAGIAASQYSGHAGVSPTSNLVSLDVMNDQGEAILGPFRHRAPAARLLRHAGAEGSTSERSSAVSGLRPTA